MTSLHCHFLRIVGNENDFTTHIEFGKYKKLLFPQYEKLLFFVLPPLVILTGGHF